MNLIETSPWWLIALLLLVLVAAAVEDGARLRISNLTSGFVVILAVIAILLQGFPVAVWQNAVVAIAILAIGTGAFAAGLFGGGDIKLMAAIGLWLNFGATLSLLVSIALAGGLLAILYMGGRRILPARCGTDRRSLKLPYGLAIVAGALFVFGTQALHRPTDPVLDRLGVTSPYK